MKQARLGYSEETSPIAGLLMNSTVPAGVIPKIQSERTQKSPAKKSISPGWRRPIPEDVNELMDEFSQKHQKSSLLHFEHLQSI